MKKILVFTDKISLSGASKIVNWLTNKLANEKDLEVTLITHLKLDDQRYVNPNIKRIKLCVRNGNRVIHGFSTIKRLRKIIRKEKFDLCIGFLPTECLYLLMSAIALNAKVIVCERSDPYFEKSLIADIGRFLYQFADGAVFQTDGAKCYFNLSLQRKGIVIPNPAFPINGNITPYLKRKHIIVTSGRLFIRQKRQDILIKAFKKVCEVDNKVILRIYGDGPDKTHLIRICDQLGVIDRVEFKGNAKNVENLIGECKVFVLSSDYEGIPNVIIEAMQQGVPVITTDCSPGGARVLIDNGINGSIVPIHNVNELAFEILRILKNPEIAVKYIENGLKITDRYNEEKIFSMWNQYIRKFLGV